jgi:hypothetical protein
MADVTGLIQNIPIARVIIGNRQREDLGDIVSLQLSIETKGLQYPIIVQPRDDGNFTLLAGGRRLQAFKELQRREIPAIFRDQLDEISRQELELEENIQRKQLNYLEEAKAISKIDKLKREKYGSALPGRFAPKGGWTQRDTAKALGFSEGKISQDIQIAEAVEKYPELASLPSRRDVLRELDRIVSGLKPLDRIEAADKSIEESFISMSVTDAIKNIPSDTVDLLILDYTEEIFQETFSEIKRMLKLTGQGFIFASFDRLLRVKEYMHEVKLMYQEKPFVWHIKAQDDYIPFLWFSRNLQEPNKGFKKLHAYSQDKDALHSLAKPRELYYEMINRCSDRGNQIVHLTAHDLNCIKTGLELRRNVRAFCPLATLWEQYHINISRL